MKNWGKIILILGIVGLVAAFLVYKFVYNKPHTDYAKAKPEVVEEASVCFDEFVNNRTEAEQKYNGKVVQLTGPFTRWEQNDSLLVLVFVFNQGDFGDEGIRCTLLPGIDTASLNVKPGMQLTVKGLLTGYNETDVILENCSIVKP
ncbi:MAG: OB-fold protein [Bacteroidales bacterium]